jgi:hypothetical protein
MYSLRQSECYATPQLQPAARDEALGPRPIELAFGHLLEKLGLIGADHERVNLQLGHIQSGRTRLQGGSLEFGEGNTSTANPKKCVRTRTLPAMLWVVADFP